MAALMDKIKGMTKGKLILIITLAVVVIYYISTSFGGKKEDDAGQHQVKNEVAEVQDATSKNDDGISSLDAMRQGYSDISPTDYYDQLSQQDDGMSLVGGSTQTTQNRPTDTGEAVAASLDRSQYTEMEITNIRYGIWTKQYVDSLHLAKRNAQSSENGTSQRSRLSSAQRDSMYMNRFSMVYNTLKQAQGEDTDDKDTANGEDKNVDEPKHIEIKPKALPSTTLQDEGIITSLDDSEPVSSSGSITPGVSPAKVTFLKSETVISGHRISMRLLQDLTLSDGTVVPANTHLKGICELGDRLKIVVSTVNYGGKIYYTCLDAYDNDGTEGIYCPAIVSNKAAKAGKRVAANVVSDVSSTASSVLRGVPTVGRAASNVLNEISRFTDSEGNVSINISSGYEFYLFENTKKNEER